MKNSIPILLCCFVAAIAFTSGYEFSHVRDKKLFYRALSDSEVAELDLNLRILESMRSENNNKTLHMLEVATLTELPSLVFEEKVLGWTDDMQGITKRISDYCNEYKVFDSYTNLPSHIAAKKFLDSHLKVVH